VSYLALRKHYDNLYTTNAQDMESYKNRALRLHQNDIANHHKNNRWTPNGVIENPWLFSTGTTQTTNEIVNPIFIFLNTSG